MYMASSASPRGTMTCLLDGTGESPMDTQWAGWNKWMVARTAVLVLGCAACSRAPKPQREGASSATPPVLAAPIALPKPRCPEGMVEIPGGKFFMGSDAEDALDLEKPSHIVTLSPYCIDKNEVTTGQFKACIDTGQC